MYLLVLAAAALSSLVLAYFLAPTKGRGRLVCLLFTDFLSKCFLLTTKAFLAAVNAAYSVVTLFSILMWVRLALVLGLAILVHEYPHKVLVAMNGFWREVVTPMHEVVLFVLHQVRFIYATGIGMYNIFIAVQKQVVTNSLILVSKCNAHYVPNMILMVVKLILAWLNALIQWFGAGKMDDTFAVNDFNVTGVVSATREIVLYQEDIGSCVCESFKPIFTFAFNFLRPEITIPLAFHTTNIGVSALQEVLKVFPPFQKYPIFAKSYYHSEKFLHLTGQYVDEVIRLQLEWLFSLQPFPLKLPPERFVGTISSSLAGAVLAASYKIFRQILLLPRGTLDMSSFPDETFRYIYLMLDDLQDVLVYFLEALTVADSLSFTQVFIASAMHLAKGLTIFLHALSRLIFNIFVDFENIVLLF